MREYWTKVDLCTIPEGLDGLPFSFADFNILVLGWFYSLYAARLDRPPMSHVSSAQYRLRLYNFTQWPLRVSIEGLPG